MGLWLVFQMGSGFQYVQLESERMQVVDHGSNAFIDAAKRVGLDAVGLLGGTKFRLEGQRFSADADEVPLFFNLEDERYLPYANRFDEVDQYAYALRAHHGARMRESLEALQCSWESEAVESFLLVHHFSPKRVYPEVGWRWVEQATVVGRPSLSDQSLQGMEFAVNDVLVIDAGGVVKLDRLWLTEPEYRHDRLPLHYQIEISLDGVTYSPLDKVSNRLPIAEIVEDRFFVGHRYGRLEHRFAGQEARYVRLTLGASSSPQIELGEVKLFEEVEPWSNAEPSELIHYLKNQKVHTVYANLLMSAKLRASGLRVLPRYNPRFTKTSRSRTLAVDRSTTCVVVERALAEHTERLLGKAGYRFERSDFGAYSSFLAMAGEAPNASSLHWSGRHLLTL